MSADNKVGRDELFARVEILKLARDITSASHDNDTKGPSGVVSAAETLWAFAADGREIAGGCGCGDKEKQPKGFSGTHVVPFSWIPNKEGTNYKMFVMDFVFAEVELTKGEGGAVMALLKRDSYDTQVFTGAEPVKEALAVANTAVTQWLNANPEVVASWLDKQQARQP